MNCPTCSHTLHAVCQSDGDRVCWCPRCGSLIAHGEHSPPKLVERCREYEKMLRYVPERLPHWKAVGIAEAINTPENR